MKIRRTTMAALFCLLGSTPALGFTAHKIATSSTTNVPNSATSLNVMKESSAADEESPSDTLHVKSRRNVLKAATQIGGSLLLGSMLPEKSDAAVGTLPEFEGTNAIIQGITVNVADKVQQDQMIAFLSNGFDFQVLRKRINMETGVEDTWMGFGPEQLSPPADFEVPVSSFAMNGGHASIHIRYNSQATTLLYKGGEQAPGDNIAFLQVGVPGYRISQMVASGGNILDAYGHVNVMSPAGLQLRGIVGIHPDPIMMVAINCPDVQQSREFYQQLGFVEQEYPYARLTRGTTPSEPAQPKGSVYMAPSPNCMGVLLQKSKKKKVTANPVFESLNIVYNPPEETDASYIDDDDSRIADPSNVAIRFQSFGSFEKEELKTR